MGLAAAAVPEGLAAGDAEEPRAELVGGPEAVQVPVGGDEGVLDGVAGVVPGAEDGGGDEQRRPLVAGDEAGEGVAVAAAGAADEVLVRLEQRFVRDLRDRPVSCVLPR